MEWGGVRVEAGPIGYVTTADGVSIAHQRFGKGAPVARFSALPFLLRVQPHVLGLSATGALSPVRSTLAWDPRGVGMSDRSVVDFSLDTWIADAAAVVETIGHPVPVMASGLEGPVALAFTARRPDLVSHLVLNSTSAHGEEMAKETTTRVVRAVLEVDFVACLDYVVRAVAQMQEPAASEVVEVISQELDAEVLRAGLVALATHDARDVVSDIAVPTLIVETSQLSAQRERTSGSRELSREIAGARLVTPQSRDEAADILAFLEADQTGSHGAFRTIMFTDLVSSTALTQRVGDAAAQEVVEAHDAAVRDALTAHSGVEVKHTGDGIMAAFDSATDAAHAALQLAVALREEGVEVRVGLNAGEPIERDGDLFGTAVQLAARVCDAANEGQVLATRVVRDLTAGKGLSWTPTASIDAKGFDEPVTVFSLHTPN